MNDPQNPYSQSADAQGAGPQAEPQSRALQLSDNSCNHRQGRVARLPKAVRDKINLMLLDGHPYAEIIQALGKDGELLNENNLSTWRLGGYQDWLKQQQVLEQMRIRGENAAELIGQSEGATLHEAANKLARSEERRVGKECRSRWSPYH